MEVGLVKKIDIDSEMQQAYLDYAMSVIVARALPDARDGLKPVHRRILYAMHDMGIRADSPYKKSARIVGEVLGKYHPHGDLAVYESMARMAQDFSMRYLLVDGQGNFGSVDGDPPAAMRYTEARLASPAMSMLTDIQKNTVDFINNFDGTLTEPLVLPSALPNLLVNGATGIAVGMATNIPPHNLGEVVDALRYMLENWEKIDDMTLDDLMQFVQGPDFPTGGIIFHEGGSEDEGLRSAYGSGRGRVTLQAKAHLEEMERGKNRIIVSELPYMTNKASLIERIAELVRDGKLEGISDLRDESDRHGMRIVIELTKTADSEAILRDLYKHTPMQSTVGIILLALVDGEPRLMTLKTALKVFLEHRLGIIRRRSEFDLERARARAHILEGLRIALKNLDEIIELIRKSPDVETARARLIKRFKLSEIQAQAILDMPLRRLAALERKRIEDEYQEVTALIKELEGLLKSPKKMREVVAAELLEVKITFGDRRRTQIINLKEGEKKSTLLTAQDLQPDRTTWVGVTADGLISRPHEEKQPLLSGKSAPLWLVQANLKDTLFVANQRGEAAVLAVHALPEAEDLSGGAPFWKITALAEGVPIAGMFALPPKERPEDRFVVSISSQGMVKKTALSELPGPSAGTITLAKINPDDSLTSVQLSDGKQDLLLVTASGMAIRFSEEETRPMGLVAAGVMGIKLQENDRLVGGVLLPPQGQVLLVAANGSAKRVDLADFPRQGRNGQGVIAWKLLKNIRLTGIAVGSPLLRVALHFNRLLPKPVRLDEAILQGRATQGKTLIDLKPGDEITGVCVPVELPGKAAELEGGEKKKRSSRPVKADGALPAAASHKRKAAQTEPALEQLNLLPEPGTKEKKAGKAKAAPKAPTKAPAVEEAPAKKKAPTKKTKPVT